MHALILTIFLRVKMYGIFSDFVGSTSGPWFSGWPLLLRLSDSSLISRQFLCYHGLASGYDVSVCMWTCLGFWYRYRQIWSWSQPRVCLCCIQKVWVSRKHQKRWCNDGAINPSSRSKRFDGFWPWSWLDITFIWKSLLTWPRMTQSWLDLG